MRSELFASLRLTGITIAVCLVAYPLGMLALAAVVAPETRMGSLVLNGTGQVVGSRLLAQGFTRPEYFWPRPSAVDYDAAAAGGSNLSPANPALRERAETIISRLDLPASTPVPADLVAASGGGLDPHISYVGALVQVGRVAKARDLGEDEVRQLIDQVAEVVPLVTNNEKIVNVLQLNLHLDGLVSSESE